MASAVMPRSSHSSPSSSSIALLTRWSVYSAKQRRSRWLRSLLCVAYMNGTRDRRLVPSLPQMLMRRICLSPGSVMRQKTTRRHASSRFAWRGSVSRTPGSTSIVHRSLKGAVEVPATVTGKRHSSSCQRLASETMVSLRSSSDLTCNRALIRYPECPAGGPSTRRGCAPPPPRAPTVRTAAARLRRAP